MSAVEYAGVIKEQGHPRIRFSFFRKIRNMGGYIFFYLKIMKFGDFATSFHDVNGFVNMLKLKKELMEKDIEKQAIQDFLNANSTKYHNPYTLEPLTFDSSKNEICYESLKVKDGKKVIKCIELN